MAKKAAKKSDPKPAEKPADSSENGSQTDTITPKKPREPRPVQKDLTGFEKQVDDPAMEKLVLMAYEKTLDFKQAKADMKEARSRLEMAMELKKIKYYRADDGTEAEYPDAKRKVKLHREKEEDEAA